MTVEPQWLTPRQVGEILQCTARHVRRLISDELLQAVDLRRPGCERARWRVSAASVSEVLWLRMNDNGLQGHGREGGRVSWDLAIEEDNG